MADGSLGLGLEHGVRLSEAVELLKDAVRSGDEAMVLEASETLSRWCVETYRLGFEHGRSGPSAGLRLH